MNFDSITLTDTESNNCNYLDISMKYGDSATIAGIKNNCLKAQKFNKLLFKVKSYQDAQASNVQSGDAKGDIGAVFNDIVETYLGDLPVNKPVWMQENSVTLTFNNLNIKVADDLSREPTALLNPAKLEVCKKEVRAEVLANLKNKLHKNINKMITVLCLEGADANKLLKNVSEAEWSDFFGNDMDASSFKSTQDARGTAEGVIYSELAETPLFLDAFELLKVLLTKHETGTSADTSADTLDISNTDIANDTVAKEYLREIILDLFELEGKYTYYNSIGVENVYTIYSTSTATTATTATTVKVWSEQFDTSEDNADVAYLFLNEDGTRFPLLQIETGETFQRNSPTLNLTASITVYTSADFLDARQYGCEQNNTELQLEGSNTYDNTYTCTASPNPKECFCGSGCKKHYEYNAQSSDWTWTTYYDNEDIELSDVCEIVADNNTVGLPPQKNFNPGILISTSCKYEDDGNGGLKGLTVTHNGPATYAKGPNPVTWTISDENNSKDYDDTFFTLVDTGKPNLTPKIAGDNNQFNTDSGECTATKTINAPSVVDNCGSDSVTITNNLTGDEGDIQKFTFPAGVTKIIWTAKDASGNEDTDSQTITVLDNQPPTLTVAADQTEIKKVADTGLCTAYVTVNVPEASDNCREVTLTHNSDYSTDTGNASGIYPVGNTPITWTATAAGKTATATQIITVTDTQAPTIGTIPDISHSIPKDESTSSETPGTCTYTHIFNKKPSAFDNCGNIPATHNLGSDSKVFNIGETPITWTAVDAAGNSTTATQKVIVSYPHVPIISATNDINDSVTLELCLASVTIPIPDVSTVNNCYKVTLECTLDGSECSGFHQDSNVFEMNLEPGNHEITWTATDTAGTVSKSIQTINVTDTQAPKINLTDSITVDNDLDSCTAYVDVIATATDNCSDSNVIEFVNDFNDTGNASGIYPVGVTPVIWTATDAAGNTSTEIQIITVNDTQPPKIIKAAADQTQNTDSSVCTAVVTVIGPEIIDNCGDVTLTNDFNDTGDATGTYPLGETPVIWTATDAAGKTSTDSQTITVVDKEGPTITLSYITMGDLIEDLCVAEAIIPIPKVEDNCSETLGLTYEYTDLQDDSETGNTLIKSYFKVGETEITWTATDAANNTTTDTQTITVNDERIPTIENIGDVNVKTADSNVFIVGSSDSNVFIVGAVSEILIQVAIPYIDGTCREDLTLVNSKNGTSNATGTYSVGVHTVTWKVKDPNDELKASATQTITVLDIGKPNLTPNIVDPFDTDLGACTATKTIVAPQTTDNDKAKSDSVTITNNLTADIGDIKHHTFLLGVTKITWTATDASGNTASADQDITVLDKQPPTLTVAADQTEIKKVADTGLCTAYVTVTGPEVLDNCVDVTLVNDFNNSANASDIYPVGETTITWTATDKAGKTATATQTITVVDTQAPSIITPDIIKVNNVPGVCTAYVVVTRPEASDNCGVVSFVNDFNNSNNASDTYPVGNTPVTWTATDAAGKTATATQIITVIDNEEPTISVEDQTQDTDTGVCTAYVVVTGPEASDNCGVVSFVNDRTGTADASGIYPVGNTPITWTATAAGKTATATQIITVVDTQAPTITSPDSITLNNDTGHSFATKTVNAPSVVDNCDSSDSVTITNNLLNATTNEEGDIQEYIFDLGETEITWTATDKAGKTATATQIITVIDTESPTFKDPSFGNDTFEYVRFGVDYVFTPIECTDNVDGLIDTVNIAGGIDTTSASLDSAPDQGGQKLQYTCMDTAGNSASYSRKIIVQRPPAITMEKSNMEHEYATTFTDDVKCLGDYITTITTAILGEKNTYADMVNTVGTYTIKYTCTYIDGTPGDLNLTTTASREVKVVDSKAPVITLNELELTSGHEFTDSTASSDSNYYFEVTQESVTYTTDPAVAIEPNSNDSLTITITGDTINFNKVGEYVRTYDATDPSENKATTLTRTVHVIDTTDPVITFGENSDNSQIYLENKEYTQSEILDNFNSECSDNSGANFNENIVFNLNYSAATPYNRIVNFSCVDDSENRQDIQKTLKFVGLPVLTIPQGEKVYEYFTDFNDDNVTCSGDYATTRTSVIKDAKGSVATPEVMMKLVGDYTIEYTCTYTNPPPELGLTTTANRAVKVEDSLAPVITLETLNNMECHNNNDSCVLQADKNYIYSDNESATDQNSDSVVLVVVTEPEFKPDTVGSYVFKYTATDKHMKTSTKHRTVHVVDTTPPEMSKTSETIFIEKGVYLTEQNLFGVKCTDNSSDTLSFNNTGAININPKQTPDSQRIVYNCTDSSGNKATEISKEVIIRGRPTLLLNGDITTTIEYSGTFNADDYHSKVTCPGDYGTSIGFTSKKITATQRSSIANINQEVGKYEITYTCTDSVALTNETFLEAEELTRTLYVTDTLPPVITLNELYLTSGHELISLDNSEYLFEVTQDDVTYTDNAVAKDQNSDSIIILDITGDDINFNVVGEYVRTYNATDINFDDSPPATSLTRTVNVIDTTNPEFKPSSTDVQYVAKGTTYESLEISCTDASSPNYFSSTSQFAVNMEPESTPDSQTLLYTCKDASDNMTQFPHTVVVRGKPVISLNADADSIVTYEYATSLDSASLINDVTCTGDAGYGVFTISLNSDNVNIDSVGEYTITYTCTDGTSLTNGDNLQSTYERGVKVTDTNIPVITLNQLTLSGDNSFTAKDTSSDSNYYFEVTQKSVTYTDNAIATDPNSSEQIDPTKEGEINFNKVGTYVLTYNATDKNGHKASTVTRTVHVEDTTPPVITLPADKPNYVNHIFGKDIDIEEIFGNNPTCSDNSGDIELNAVVGSINVHKEGIQNIQYTCNDGYQSVSTSVSVRIIGCPKGEYYVNNSGGKAFDSNTIASCETCPDGTYRDNLDYNSPCKPCSDGHYSNVTVGHEVCTAWTGYDEDYDEVQLLKNLGGSYTDGNNKKDRKYLDCNGAPVGDISTLSEPNLSTVLSQDHGCGCMEILKERHFNNTTPATYAPKWYVTDNDQDSVGVLSKEKIQECKGMYHDWLQHIEVKHVFAGMAHILHNEDNVADNVSEMIGDMDEELISLYNKYNTDCSDLKLYCPSVSTQTNVTHEWFNNNGSDVAMVSKLPEGEKLVLVDEQPTGAGYEPSPDAFETSPSELTLEHNCPTNKFDFCGNCIRNSEVTVEGNTFTAITPDNINSMGYYCPVEGDDNTSTHNTQNTASLASGTLCAKSCELLSKCDANKTQDTEPTTFSDRTCSLCPVGTGSNEGMAKPGDGAAGFNDCITCLANQYSDAEETGMDYSVVLPDGEAGSDQLSFKLYNISSHWGWVKQECDDIDCYNSLIPSPNYGDFLSPDNVGQNDTIATMYAFVKAQGNLTFDYQYDTSLPNSDTETLGDWFDFKVKNLKGETLGHLFESGDGTQQFGNHDGLSEDDESMYKNFGDIYASETHDGSENFNTLRWTIIIDLDIFASEPGLILEWSYRKDDKDDMFDIVHLDNFIAQNMEDIGAPSKTTINNGCKNCPANTGSEPGSTSCTDCPAGEGSTSGGHCAACNAGQFSTSGEPCTACEANYSSNSGDFVCFTCPEGKGSTSGGSCTACPANQYSIREETGDILGANYEKVPSFWGDAGSDQWTFNLYKISSHWGWEMQECVDSSCSNSLIPSPLSDNFLSPDNVGEDATIATMYAFVKARGQLLFDYQYDTEVSADWFDFKVKNLKGDVLGHLFESGDGTQQFGIENYSGLSEDNDSMYKDFGDIYASETHDGSFNTLRWTAMIYLDNFATETGLILEWSYTKDDNNSMGADTVHLDNFFTIDMEQLDELTPNTGCQNCSANHYSAEGSAACTACSAGQESESGEACTKCLAGEKSISGEACTACPDGEYQDQTGQVSCIECSAGKYRDTNVLASESESEACQACPDGEYQDQTGQVSCIACPAGTYRDVNVSASQSESAACKACPLGTYQDQTGQLSCIGCPEGEYQNETGQPSCKLIDETMTVNKDGVDVDLTQYEWKALGGTVTEPVPVKGPYVENRIFTDCKGEIHPQSSELFAFADASTELICTYGADHPDISEVTFDGYTFDVCGPPRIGNANLGHGCNSLLCDVTDIEGGFTYNTKRAVNKTQYVVYTGRVELDEAQVKTVLDFLVDQDKMIQSSVTKRIPVKGYNSLENYNSNAGDTNQLQTYYNTAMTEAIKANNDGELPSDYKPIKKLIYGDELIFKNIEVEVSVDWNKILEQTIHLTHEVLDSTIVIEQPEPGCESRQLGACCVDGVYIDQFIPNECVELNGHYQGIGSTKADVTDQCGVCGGDNSTCTDLCGVVNGDNSTCTDLCGVVNGDNRCLNGYWKVAGEFTPAGESSKKTIYCCEEPLYNLNLGKACPAINTEDEHIHSIERQVGVTHVDEMNCFYGELPDSIIVYTDIPDWRCESIQSQSCPPPPAANTEFIIHTNVFRNNTVVFADTTYGFRLVISQKDGGIDTPILGESLFVNVGTHDIRGEIIDKSTKRVLYTKFPDGIDNGWEKRVLFNILKKDKPVTINDLNEYIRVELPKISMKNPNITDGDLTTGDYKFTDVNILNDLSLPDCFDSGDCTTETQSFKGYDYFLATNTPPERLKKGEGFRNGDLIIAFKIFEGINVEY